MKLPFLNKNNSSTSCSSSSNSNSSSTNYSSWPWPSCNQNPKTISFRATISFTNPIHDQEDDDELGPQEITESIENVIKGIKSSERLIFESKGESNSILEEAMAKNDEEDEKKEEGEGFMLLSLESNDPYSDFKRSMEDMVEAYALHHDWRSLENLLFQFLQVNAKTTHRYIFAAFVDLLLKLALKTKTTISNNNNFATEEGISASRATGEASTSSSNSMSLGAAPSSPLSSPFSFYTSCSSYSSSDDTSSASVRFLPLSSLLEMEEKTKDILV